MTTRVEEIEARLDLHQKERGASHVDELGIHWRDIAYLLAEESRWRNAYMAVRDALSGVKATEEGGFTGQPEVDSIWALRAEVKRLEGEATFWKEGLLMTERELLAAACAELCPYCKMGMPLTDDGLYHKPWEWDHPDAKHVRPGRRRSGMPQFVKCEATAIRALPGKGG